MTVSLPLPRLIFGAGTLPGIASELPSLGVERPLLISDRGLERAGITAIASRAMPSAVPAFDVTEHPTIAGVDACYQTYLSGSCDGVVALGGGSVIDTAKFVAALAGGGAAHAAELLGHPERINRNVAPLVAIPTTVGSGSESSPAAGLHAGPHSRAVGTRSPFLVPRLAICDPDLIRTLPPRLIAATGIDAMAHCLEGYFAEPADPIVDALALDGIVRAYKNVQPATQPGGDMARAELMAAAFAGGAAIHKGLGPAHAVAIICGDQGLHHGLLVAIALPLTVSVVAPHVPSKTDRIASALGLSDGNNLSEALRALNRALGIPATLREAGYRPGPIEDIVDGLVHSHFNKTSPHVPSTAEYFRIAEELLS